MDDNQGAAAELEQVLFQVKRVIVGQDHMVERLLVALLARGHILLEGVPGVAKTLAVSTLSDAIGGSFVRLQFTPDLLPSDLIGTRIWRASQESFDIEWGPVFSNLVLTDEINRAPAKVQSALLEVMAEGQVSVGGETRKLPQPFLVLATQNPVESEGVYTLPEAQRDRFLMKVTVPYPSPAEEIEIVRRVGASLPQVTQAMTLERLEALQTQCDDIYVDAAVAGYAVDIVMATREPSLRGLPELEPLIDFGVSPRATLGLVGAGRALALLRGRSYVMPQDVFDVARDVLRHRLMLSYEALAKDLTADDILNRLLAIVPAANVSPRELAGTHHHVASVPPVNQLQPLTPSNPVANGATTGPSNGTAVTNDLNLPPIPAPPPVPQDGIGTGPITETDSGSAAAPELPPDLPSRPEG